MTEKEIDIGIQEMFEAEERMHKIYIIDEDFEPAKYRSTIIEKKKKGKIDQKKEVKKEKPTVKENRTVQKKEVKIDKKKETKIDQKKVSVRSSGTANKKPRSKNLF